MAAFTVFMKCFFLIIRKSKPSNILKKIMSHLMLNIQEKFFLWSDNIMSDDCEQIIRHFAKSSAMSDGPMAFREDCLHSCQFRGSQHVPCATPWLKSVTDLRIPSIREWGRPRRMMSENVACLVLTSNTMIHEARRVPAISQLAVAETCVIRLRLFRNFEPNWLKKIW